MTSFTIGDTGTFKGDPVTFTSMEKRKAGWFIRLTRKGGDTFALSTTQVATTRRLVMFRTLCSTLWPSPPSMLVSTGIAVSIPWGIPSPSPPRRASLALPSNYRTAPCV